MHGCYVVCLIIIDLSERCSCDQTAIVATTAILVPLTIALTTALIFSLVVIYRLRTNFTVFKSSKRRISSSINEAYGIMEDGLSQKTFVNASVPVSMGGSSWCIPSNHRSI